MKKLRLALILCLVAALAFSAYGPAVRSAAAEGPAYPQMVEDVENKEAHAAEEAEIAQEFAWYKWYFEIDPAIDTVGEIGDGVGELYFRLFTPAAAEGEKYPVVLQLGGLGSSNDTVSNGYAARALDFASEANQAVNPCYVLAFNMPFEACVNYEAELCYLYQHGEIVKYLAEQNGNLDLDRVYATGHSQGAGWSYELAAVQPDLLAAILINAGTTVHTTWGDQCDMKAIADSDVNVYIWHGFNDPFIPVNEAYRAFNTLSALGKKNIEMKIQDGNSVASWLGHVNVDLLSAEGPTEYMTWMFEQVKGVPCVEEPTIISEDGTYADYSWAGVQVFSGAPFMSEPVWAGIEGWQTANEYATWVEPAENATWDQVKEETNAFAEGAGGTGKTVLAKIRIGDETSTSYDDPAAVIAPGDTVAVTVQGYTGGYGDDAAAFDEEWSVDWAVLQGSVTNIELTHEASAEPIARPDTVTLANGGGPNVNNSLATDNALDGEQVYVKIDTAEEFEGEQLAVAIRFTRDLGNGEYASYYHIVKLAVEG